MKLGDGRMPADAFPNPGNGERADSLHVKADPSRASKELPMENDRVFKFYAGGLVLLTATMVVCAIVTLGGTFPPPEFMGEHLAMSLLFRSAYKSFDGSNWIRSAAEYANLITSSDEMNLDGSIAGAVS
jgi:hypothetical protein